MSRVLRRFGPCLLLALGTLTVGRDAARGDVPPLVKGLANPESATIGPDGRVYLSLIGAFDTDGDGSIVVLQGIEPVEFAAGLDDPKGLAFVGRDLFVADRTRIVRLDPQGRRSTFVAAEAFPQPPKFLNDLVADDSGGLFVSDSGAAGQGGAVYHVSAQGEVSAVKAAAASPDLKAPNGLLRDGPHALLVLDFVTGALVRLDLASGTATRLAAGFEGGDGLARDRDGRLYASQWTTGRVSILDADGGNPRLLAEHFDSAADLCISHKSGHALVPDMRAGTLTALAVPDRNPADVDTRPLDEAAIERAFPRLTFDRPIVLTHAGDGSGRVFVASQKGKVFVFEGDDPAEARLFFDLEPRVKYDDNQNEEGFLGLAFHPRFRETGEFFVYYTTRDTPHVSVVSRFRVAADDPNVAHRDSEEELLRIPQPYWNHNGGTLVFGPDGYLYIGLGDGGAANDPHGNGQNLNTLLGSILRIDVDRRDPGKAYAVPVDNPFVGRADAQTEIWAYGLRNVWRMAFDRATGQLWAADVGQDIWEEINLVTRGGNYGWNLREGRHVFGPEGSPPRPDLIEPVWEYHHDVGKSLTGGCVYRGSRVPALAGAYLYADYVTGQVWALWYDDQRGQTTANRAIAGNIQPVMSFGEDEAGEVYFLATDGAVYRFVGQ